MKKRLLELDLQELERLRIKKPCTLSQAIWAKRVYQLQRSTQLPLQSNNGKGSNSHDVEAEEEDFVEDMDIEAEGMEVEAKGMEVSLNRSQETQISQPIGVGMWQQLEFLAQHMTA